MDNNLLFLSQKLIKEYWKSDKKLPWVPEVFFCVAKTKSLSAGGDPRKTTPLVRSVTKNRPSCDWFFFPPKQIKRYFLKIMPVFSFFLFVSEVFQIEFDVIVEMSTYSLRWAGVRLCYTRLVLNKRSVYECFWSLHWNMVTWTVDDFEFHLRFQVLTYQITFGCPGKIRWGRCRVEEITFVGKTYGCWNKSKEHRRKRKNFENAKSLSFNTWPSRDVTFTWYEGHLLTSGREGSVSILTSYFS